MKILVRTVIGWMYVDAIRTEQGIIIPKTN